MIVSLDDGTPIQTPIHYNIYYRDHQSGIPNLGMPHIRLRFRVYVGLRGSECLEFDRGCFRP